MNQLSDQYDEGLIRGQLLIQRCTACGRHAMYPRYSCPFCQQKELEWVESSGSGSLHSYTVLRIGAPSGFEEELPYALGVIKLDEGVQLLGRLRPDETGTWDCYTCDTQVQFSAGDPPAAGRRPAAWFRSATPGRKS